MYQISKIFFLLQDIFRKYPNKYESIIATLCENLDTLDEPEARYVISWLTMPHALVNRGKNCLLIWEILDGHLKHLFVYISWIFHTEKWLMKILHKYKNENLKTQFECVFVSMTF